MTAVDSSVAIAALSSWHEHHERAHEVVARRPSIVSHAALETYSVLTRLPAPIRVRGAVVADLLRRSFREPIVACSPRRQVGLVARLAELEIVGGAVYDALIALTVLDADEELVTLDTRALRTYERVGASARLLDGNGK